MKINDIFLKDIHRNIDGVITATKTSDEQIYQELDEYVVTKELQSHFQVFFDAYKRGVLSDTSKMGVWIQGFFGSGKSHFLKILAYILENKEINGKTALDFFIEGDQSTRKINNDITIADMKLATDVPTNVILFNVESKHQTGIEERNSLVNVFLKVFNDSLGYSTNPKVADLERSLSAENKYELFKMTFENIHGKKWLEERHKVDFLQDAVVDTLVEINYMSENAANNWFSKLEAEYIISIEEFAILVENYLKSQGNNQHIVFLVDEIGQYIGGNSDLTLQLQTIVEELGNKSRGKAWVIVTSQQAIDKITDIAGTTAMDFSKIKGRFETTLSLSSANADEVIQKRILAKNSNGQNFLRADYPNHESNLKLMLDFEDSPELKLYSSAENYADVYPFIPYQFNLLANVLTQISKHSIQGANLSRGERSLLAFYKETAERVADQDCKLLVSFDQFYPSLEKWLNESDNAKVIKQAEENTRIVSEESDLFNIDVLKVLFMIKYVDQNIKPTLNNITNLMIRDVNEDKLMLRKKVEKSLKILIHENLIRQNLQSFIFQTDEEQEVSRLINNIELNTTDVENKLATDIFDDKVGRNSFAYINSHARSRIFENRYTLFYNLYIDNYAFRKNSNPQLEVKVITPNNDEIWGDETQLILQSTKNQMLIKLPADTEFMNNLITFIKVEKYITTVNATSAIKNFAAVKAEKTSENQELNESISNQLDVFLKQATFYFNNNKLEVVGSDFKARLNDGLQQMAKLVYHKNDLVDAPMTESDINKYLSGKEIGIVKATENQNVVDEIRRVIEFQSVRGLSVSLKILRDTFVNKEPYGFVNEDLEWAVARLFKEGSITLFKNGIPLSTNDDINEISKAIFERKAAEKIRIELRINSDDKQKKIVQKIGEELFNSRNIVDESNDDITRNKFNEKSRILISELNTYESDNASNYPQSEIITDVIRGLESVMNLRDTHLFFEMLEDKEDDFLDWAEDLVDIKNFHTSNQKIIWDKTKNYINRIERSTIKESTQEIDLLIDKMKEILKQSVPYRDIPNLSILNAEFEQSYMEFIESKSTKATEKIQIIYEEIIQDLKNREFEEVFSLDVADSFNHLIDDLSRYQSLDEIELAPVQAKALKNSFIEKFTDEENKRRQQAAEYVAEEYTSIDESKVTDKTSVEVSKPVIKKIELIQINKLIKSSTRIRTESDIEVFINDLKTELLTKLNDDNELDIRL
ncbi:MAG: BREX system P-loop protein BrxC [Vagococcus sp.]|uniref:BREX system P-loop protein BrxC n=1 Tax=Vagococcus TaxID=2737 RepID=UPI002FCAE97C